METTLKPCLWGEPHTAGKYFFTEYANQSFIIKTPITDKVKTINLLGMDFMVAKIRGKWTVTDFETGADLSFGGNLDIYKNTQKCAIELAERNLKKSGIESFKELKAKTIERYLSHNKRVKLKNVCNGAK